MEPSQNSETVMEENNVLKRDMLDNENIDFEKYEKIETKPKREYRPRANTEIVSKILTPEFLLKIDINKDGKLPWISYFCDKTMDKHF